MELSINFRFFTIELKKPKKGTVMFRTILLLLLLVFSLNAKSLFSNSKQKDSSVYIGALKNLIISTQKTRGLTNSYLNGNTATLLLVYNNRDNMKEALATMDSTELATDPVINSKASAISTALIKLNNKAFKMPPPETFAAYTEQIQNILMLAQTISQRSSKDLNDFGKEASKIMTETALPLTEYVGQLRGFGAGLAAKGKVGKHDIEKVYALSSKVTSLNSQFQQELSMLGSKYKSSLPSNIQTQVDTAFKSAKDFASLSQKKLLKSPASVDPDEFFDQGTQVIENILKVYNSLNASILKDSDGWL